MKQVLLFLTLLLCVSSSLGAGGEEKVFLGYYPVWAPSQTWKDGCGLNIADIPAHKYTHLIAFWFFEFSNTTGAVSLYKDEWSDASVLLPQLMALKTSNPSLKILLCLGGGGISVEYWKAAMGSTTKRANLIRTALAFVQQYGFDGLDIDWEGLDSETPALIQVFFRELRAAAPAGTIIAASTPASQYWLNFYHPENVVNYIDYFNVMLYDFTGFSWSETTYSNAPLNGINGLSINQSVTWYMNNGIPTSKIVFGFANFGRSFTLRNPGINQPNTNKTAGTPGSCDNQGGWLTYKEVEKIIARPPAADFLITYDEPTQTPYITYSDQYISYDNERSISAKLDFLKSKNLAGGMIYATDNSHTIADQVWDSLFPGTSSSSSSSTKSSSTSASTTKSSSTSAATGATPSPTTPPDALKGDASFSSQSSFMILVFSVFIAFLLA